MYIHMYIYICIGMYWTTWIAKLKDVNVTFEERVDTIQDKVYMHIYDIRTVYKYYKQNSHVYKTHTCIFIRIMYIKFRRKGRYHSRQGIYAYICICLHICIFIHEYIC
jgi:hypothetical protein